MQKFFPLTFIGSALLVLTACSAAPPKPDASPADSSVGQNAPSSVSGQQASPNPSPSPGASPSPGSSPAASPTTSASTSEDPAQSVQPKQIAASSAKPSMSATTQEITVYRLDDQCDKYVGEKLPMPVQGAPEAIVAQVLQNSNNPDFSVANYRVNVKNGVATVDFRLPANAKRPFQALSTCEQMALLGSIDKTLKENSSLKIQSVRFTDGKEELMF